MKVDLTALVNDILATFNKRSKEHGNTNIYKIEINEVEEPKGKFTAHLYLIDEQADGQSTIVFNLKTPLSDKYSERHLPKWKNYLLRSFIYESIGLLAVSATSMVNTQMKAAFDKESGRLKADDKWAGKSVIVLDTAPEDAWYGRGNGYDIFTQTDEGWGVYSDLEEHRDNNGIGVIPGKYARLITE